MLIAAPEIVPSPLPLGTWRGVTLLAPHPDDETLGAGGLIAHLAQQSLPLQLLLLTPGDAQGDPNQRLIEWQAALRHLGIPSSDHPPPFGDRTLARSLPDLTHYLLRHLPTDPTLYPHLLLAPHPLEPNPDHQATALAAWQIVARHNLHHPTLPLDLAWYEIGAPLPNPTHLFPLSPSLLACKNAAAALYTTQNRSWNYLDRILALNRYRALPLGPETLAAEAYTLIPLGTAPFAAVLPSLIPLLKHTQHTALTPSELPSISILIRTIGDPHLESTLASVLLQTYPPTEILILGAHGASLPPPLRHLLDLPSVRYLTPSTPLNRAAAANALLDAATSDWLLFLDDDDLIEPLHLETLIQTLWHHPSARAACSQTRIIDPETGCTMGIYAYDDQPERLLLANIYPIHAVLFHRSLLDKGCRFDPHLPRHEDWDFWQQVILHTPIIPTRRCTAIYRHRNRAAFTDTPADHHLRARVLTRALDRLTPANRIARLLALADRLRHLDERHASLQHHLQDLQAALTAEQLERHRALQLLDQLRRQAAEREQLYHQQLHQITTSRSWRLTAPLRALARLLRRLTHLSAPASTP
ncbi:MAG: PIG-L family deacetylase [Hydrogenophilus sp.]|nr:PIG-L family deacetylase [Hydrogenophilus sp.]